MKEYLANATITHVAYADESYYHVGRYRAVGLVSLRHKDVPHVVKKLRAILQESGVSELKWEKLRTAKARHAALKFLKFTVDKAIARIIRVDILIWDTEDERHSVSPRDDIANLQQMYYFLFKNVLMMRWQDDAMWGVYPDEHTALRWTEVHRRLDRADTTIEERADLLTKGETEIFLRQRFNLIEVKSLQSDVEPLIQVADLFAGLSVFSRSNYLRFLSWEQAKGPQLQLFMTSTALEKFSSAEIERFTCLTEFNALCKTHKLGVSLRTECGLRTFDPSRPINFWPYIPQHP